MAAGQKEANRVTADVAGAAGDENAHKEDSVLREFLLMVIGDAMGEPEKNKGACSAVRAGSLRIEGELASSAGRPGRGEHPMSQPRYRHLQTKSEQGVLVLTPTPSRLEGDEMAQNLVEDTQAAVAHAEAKKVVVNLEHVEYLTSANFRPLLALRKKLKEVGGRMALCGLSEVVVEMFKTTRLIGSEGAFFEVQPDVEAAVASLLRDPSPSPPPGQ